MKQVEILIQKYLNDAYRKINDTRLIDKSVVENIQSKINKASEIVGLSSDDLLKNLDFQKNNLTLEKIESFLAELRTVFWLDNFGFTNIEPLKAVQSRNPDFKAKYKNKNAVIEVYCLTEKHEQKKNETLNCYVNTGDIFLSKYKSNASNKKSQLDAVDSDIKIFLCVINSNPVSRLNTKDDFKKYLKQINSDLRWGKDYHFGVLTGLESNGISDDTIYPPLS